ncbi:threonine synthase [Blastochloris viridis]|uniref:Threonine synthase n=1 Tax=Blastochloris viridis TaxID=1079 RepID=A0A0H5BFR5_BLAVI|nr:threonine synthase [Blastochloris viridis]ALK10821.1 Threonine synthase [Blastochloris viridis]BAR99206.1 threonine synthase [Blastochloris viridis]CUU43483.1 Threonine synthase [Blastochloris viridis]
MLYVSTRGEAPALGFADALLTGLARDGGLYVPADWPAFEAETFAGFAGRRYADVAKAVMRPFVAESIPAQAFDRMVEEAYAGFHHPAVCPLVQLTEREWVLELFHGPTLAFKDVAMQLLGRLMDYVLDQRDERATIVGATSGDTGGAAIEAFRGRDRVDVVMLFPNGRVSDVQRRMMTTPPDANIHAVAIDGTFDDCQAILKALFNDHAFRDTVRLSGVNSINWARLLAQIVYYVTSAVALGAPARKLAFAVPTGNFGDVFAGYVAAKLGLPVESLIVATNVNDILARTLESGAYQPRQVTPTTSPSMDIQVSSNFERLLFDAGGRDAGAVRRQMADLANCGSFALDLGTLVNIRRLFRAARADEAEVAATIGETWRRAGYLLDPHTAVGLASARKVEVDPKTPVVVLGTAHPAKFPDAVEAASGKRPGLPATLSDLMTKPERMTVLPNDAAAVAKFVAERSRAVRAGAAR